ncbi:50s ribosomal subunit l30 [Moniliophthora roreri]|uniref:Large ribosomal subunit protein mL46 n=1 Tax=Moniliophthora roreri TaxID=221103 RepID=A0A0W0F1P7_MONRR|nr:50s ribosomal subunit l30 [Moniliophthora roreri]
MSLLTSSICRTPRAGVCTRTLATVASTPIPETQLKPRKPILSTAILLNRSPILTRTSTPFERAYYAYQARIRRALHNPFPYDFYFKQGSILETRFNMEERKRERLAFGPDFGVEDEFDAEKAAANKAAAEQLAEQEGENEPMMPRVHPSDTARDTKSLDRKGRRNIYLLLQDVEGSWRFPTGDLAKGELLHQAAHRDLFTECGDHMDAWIVSRNPIGHYKPEPKLSLKGKPLPEEVTFFFKAHIMAGQVKPNVERAKDFAWLTKQEIEPMVSRHYWDGIKDMLSDY